ncbi:MAG: hypothetical protein ACX931_01465 [Saccharospirillum sp.]
MPDNTLIEAQLARKAHGLIEAGYQLQSMKSLSDLEHWDNQVNTLLQTINEQLAEHRLQSPRLERSLKQLIQLYLAVIQEIARLEDNKAAETARLHQQRRAISG